MAQRSLLQCKPHSHTTTSTSSYYCPKHRQSPIKHRHNKSNSRPELAGVSTAALPAVCRTWWKAGIALAADLLVAVVLGREHLQRGLDDAATETEDEVEGGLLLDVVVAQRAAVLELLAGKDQPLLVGWDTVRRLLVQ
jgi:hypothetical protein